MYATSKGTSILVAEPLSMQTDLVLPEWLSNFRKNLVRILDRKLIGEDFENIDFENIDFLPEPFAVFQYYRYGIRHPLVAERTKHNVLVIDFGGGTFDTCIIETTKDGDISQSGKNSKPLAAKSIPIGGFFINQQIAINLFQNNIIPKQDMPKFRRALDLYKKWRKNELDLSTCQEDYKHFIKNFHELIYVIDTPKLSLCRTITDWELDANISSVVPVSLPEDPFKNNSSTKSCRLSAKDLRQMFIKDIWEQYLNPTISETIKRARAELQGTSISIVLLSGGSANIKWLEKLLRRDFDQELSYAEIIQIDDFQEVVAKGLAVECARRFYVQGGDFSTTTYNRLCLVLDPDNKGEQLERFVPKNTSFSTHNISGVLLPSASILRGLIDKPLEWKFRLAKPPRRNLDYYFLRSSFDTQDIQSLQNIEEHTLFTPANCSFDSHIYLQLIVKQDGTAIPKFIYKKGRMEGEDIIKEGKPFYLDMTYGQTAKQSQAYVGFDFGTSNTSISFVNSAAIKIFETRATEKSWKELSDLVSTLPYPLAAPLGNYLSQSDKTQLPKRAREFIEAALAIAAYITYLEYCVKKGKETSRYFKGFTQRSAGPLWKLLKDCLNETSKTATISLPYQELVSEEFFKDIDKAVDFVAQQKHEKVSDDQVDLLRIVRILANISQKVFDNNLLGVFEQVKRQRFANSKQYQGLFRLTHGCPPFLKTYEFKSVVDFPEESPYLLNITQKTLLPLSPLLFWDQCSKHPTTDFGHCYLFDIQEKTQEKTLGAFSYKAVGYPCSSTISLNTKYQAMAELLIDYKNQDPTINFDLIEEIKHL